MSLTQRRVVVFSLVLLGLATGTFLIVKFAQGYRPTWAKKNLQLQATGLLVATSDPTGAQVWLNGKLKTATNTTLNLLPDSYKVEIKKDGFWPWQKHLELKKELVTQADAYLFTSFPDLQGMTFTGAEEPKLSPDGQKIAYRVTGTSPANQGIWVLELVDRPLGLNREPRQILANTTAGYRWAPDSKQLIITLGQETYLADTGRLNTLKSLTKVTLVLAKLEEEWQTSAKIKEEAKIARVPTALAEILQTKAAEIAFSPDETKIMYTATASAKIPENLLPQVPTASTQKQARSLEKGKMYVYDLKEDRNFFITEAPIKPTPTPIAKKQKQLANPPDKEIIRPSAELAGNPQFAIDHKRVVWFPTSKHLLIVQNDKITIGEADGTNWIDVYTGPFVNTFAFPFPGGGRLVVLTSLGKDTPTNLYAIGLK